MLTHKQLKKVSKTASDVQIIKASKTLYQGESLWSNGIIAFFNDTPKPPKKEGSYKTVDITGRTVDGHSSGAEEAITRTAQESTHQVYPVEIFDPEWKEGGTHNGSCIPLVKFSDGNGTQLIVQSTLINATYKRGRASNPEFFAGKFTPSNPLPFDCITVKEDGEPVALLLVIDENRARGASESWFSPLWSLRDEYIPEEDE